MNTYSILPIEVSVKFEDHLVLSLGVVFFSKIEVRAKKAMMRIGLSILSSTLSTVGGACEKPWNLIFQGTVPCTLEVRKTIKKNRYFHQKTQRCFF